MIMHLEIIYSSQKILDNDSSASYIHASMVRMRREITRKLQLSVGDGRNRVAGGEDAVQRGPVAVVAV